MQQRDVNIPNPGPARGFAAAALLLGALALALLLSGVQFDLRSQLLFSGVLLVAAILVNRFGSTRVTHVLVLATLLVTTRYMYWRATSTLAFDDPWSAAAGYTLFAAEAYAYLVTLLGYVQMIRPLRRQPAPLPEDPAEWPTVDLFIPTYNESLKVVSSTVAGALNLEWPRERIAIHLLDDGDRPEFRRFAAEAGVHYRARQDNHGAKAGNLNAAIAATHGELIAIFDCDHVPVRSFLQTTVGWFIRDKNLAQLQTPHHFYNPDPIERNLHVHGEVPGEGSLFYGLIQDGNDLWNATFFCGSCAVMRRTAIEEVGGIAIETVTEDAHTSLKLHRRGWNSAYINLIQAAGLATETLAAHVNQRIRWARGLSQMLRLDNPLLARGLSLAQRLCYLNAMMHFLYALPRIVFLLAPLCFLFFDLYVIQAEALMVAAMALPHLLHSNLTTARMHGRWRRAFWAEIYETLLSFYILVPTLVALIAPSRGKFNVTEKGATTDRDYFSADVAKPFIAIAVLNFAGLMAGLYKLYGEQGGEVGTTWLNMFWALYNLIIIGVALSVACETRQTRGNFRRTLDFRAWVSTASGHRIAARTQDVSESGVAVTLDAIAPGPRHARRADSAGDFVANPGVGSVPGGARGRGPSLHAVSALGSAPDAAPGAASDAARDAAPVAAPDDASEAAANALPEAPYADADRLVIESDGGLVSLPVVLSVDEHPLLRFRFDELSFAERRALVGLLYSPADTWLGADRVARPLGALRSLAGVMGFGVRGWFRVFGFGRRDNAPRRMKSSAAGTSVVVALLALGALFASERAGAAESAPIVYEMDMLSERIGVPIELGVARFGFRVPFAVRSDSVVDSLILSLDISYRDRGERGEQRLRIRVNDEIVWRASSARASHERLEIVVPGVALDEFNALSFELDRPEELACSSTSGAPFELVVHRESRLLLDAEQISLANELSSLPLPFFDPRDPRSASLTVVLPSTPDERLLQAAGNVAGWFGRLADYRGALFEVVHDRLPRGNAVVVASGDDLPPGLQAPASAAPSISLVDNPRDPERQILLVHAPTPAGLLQAARRLEAYPLAEPADGAGSAAGGARVASATRAGPYTAPRWLPTDTEIPLGSVPGLSSESLRVSDNDFAPLIVPFSLPGDFHEPATARHRLRVDYRYAPDIAGFDEQLFVSINGREVAEVSLGDTGGILSRLSTLVGGWLGTGAAGAGDAGHAGTLELTLPADSLLADNRLEFRFSSPAALSPDCAEPGADIATRTIEARILPDSTLRLDGNGHVAALPDLALFANSGIPFTREASLGGTAIVLPDTPAEHEVALMLTALGRLAAQSGEIPHGVRVTSAANGTDREDRILIGSSDETAAIDELLAATPLVLSDGALSLDFSDARSLYQAFAAFTTPAAVRAQLGALTRDAGGARLPIAGSRGLIAEARTPGTDHGTTLLLYGETAEASENLARAIVDRRRVGELQGAATIVDDDAIDALRTGGQYITSDLSPLPTFAWWLGRNVPIALLLGVLATVLFCLALPVLLDRVAHRRLDG